MYIGAFGCTLGHFLCTLGHLGVHWVIFGVHWAFGRTLGNFWCTLGHLGVHSGIWIYVASFQCTLEHLGVQWGICVAASLAGGGGRGHNDSSGKSDIATNGQTKVVTGNPGRWIATVHRCTDGG